MNGGIRIHLKYGNNEIRIAVEAVDEAHIHVFLESERELQDAGEGDITREDKSPALQRPHVGEVGER